ncbi:membrane protein ORF131 [Cyprinid herpesvirus 3]|nr:membrane protein ORF131 [Cyprinid herpesvirus 3]
MNAVNAVQLFFLVWSFTAVCQGDDGKRINFSYVVQEFHETPKNKKCYCSVAVFYDIHCYISDISVSCDDVTGSVGKEVTLTCNISLQCPDCSIKKCKFRSPTDSVICEQELLNDSCEQSNSFTCRYTTTTAMTEKFSFFVQTKCGMKQTEFTVDISGMAYAVYISKKLPQFTAMCMACISRDITISFETPELVEAYVNDVKVRMILLFGNTPQVIDAADDAARLNVILYQSGRVMIPEEEFLIQTAGLNTIPPTTRPTPPTAATLPPIITINVADPTTTRPTTTFTLPPTTPTTPSLEQLAASRAVYEAASIAAWLAQATTPLPTTTTTTPGTTTPPAPTPGLVVPLAQLREAFDPVYYSSLAPDTLPLPQPQVARIIAGPSTIRYKVTDPPPTHAPTVAMSTLPPSTTASTAPTTPTVPRSTLHWLNPAGFANQFHNCGSGSEALFKCSKGPVAFVSVISVCVIVLTLFGVTLYKFIKKRNAPVNYHPLQ